MNNNVSCKFTSLKWEAKNTYLGMLARRLFYPPFFWRIYPPVVWRIGGFTRLRRGITPFTFMKNFHSRDYPKIPYKGEW